MKTNTPNRLSENIRVLAVAITELRNTGTIKMRGRLIHFAAAIATHGRIWK